jgi:hypothetical protein
MRASFDFALKSFKIETAVEVGVFDGENAESMMRQGIGFLHLVDPYKAHLNHGIDTDRPTYKVTQEQMDRAKQLMIKRLEPWRENYRLHECTSEEAAKEFDDNKIDYVYIDSIHSYEEEKKDISFWFPKVRPGGILGGHDYAMGSHKGDVGYLGLMRAVNEFAKAQALELHTAGGDWWVMKP